jgi:hypothetical protein
MNRKFLFCMLVLIGVLFISSTSVPLQAWDLYVRSSPDNGVYIVIQESILTVDGYTPFQKFYPWYQTLTLSAPAEYNGKKFLKWVVLGTNISSTSQNLTFYLNGNRTAVVYYVSTYTLAVQSSPDTGAGITVTPNDRNGNGSGVSNFTRIYNEGTAVTLTAPPTHNGKVFSKWEIDGSDNTNSTMTVTMNANHTVKVVYADTFPTVITTNVTVVDSTTATGGGNVTSDGGAAVTARGVCWSTSENPTIADSHTTDGTGTGIFTSSITGLSPGTIYHVRAYATNSVGTSYGDDVTFSTDPVAPTVTTDRISKIKLTTALSGGNVTSDGGAEVTARGVCWSTSPEPKLENNDKTEDGTGLGSFTSNITGLRENTRYYVRAYATNSVGTGYGNELLFKTGTKSVTVEITEPQEGAQVDGTVTIKAAVSSNPVAAPDASVMGVNKVEFYIDNTKIAEDTNEPYETAWDTTSSTDGTHTIKAVAHNLANQSSQDDITVQVVNTPPEPPEIMLNRTHLNFGASPQAGTASSSLNSTNLTTGSQKILINNIGGGSLNCTVTHSANWLTCAAGGGTGTQCVTVSADTSGLSTGTYSAAIIINDPNASNSPQTIPVTLKVYSSGTTTPPFGYFETPIDGSTVRSSIPVTGWALDDIDITSVKIYRAPIPGHETGGLIYIGDAVMVDGARPDVEQQFPGYPRDYQAGWGYMMLTNFLPNQGNGTFTIYAKATDKEGNEVTLGSKIITCDNANAVKPFGAIDTPGQGGTASGSAYVNFGWALTPQPNTIPIDGSTIKVWVDGVNIGSPTYNIYRADIANLFPGYANSNGASGYICLDTTAYENGVHTIQWTVADDAGNTDGIGSRYFTIENIGSAGIADISHRGIKRRHINGSVIQQSALSPDPVYVRKGYDMNTPVEILYPNHEGVISIQLRENQRVEIGIRSSLLWDAVVFGYMIAGDSDRLQLLPIGSTLDMTRGIFYWQPCAGFFGQYRFVFVEKGQNGELEKKIINVVIEPKF